MILAHCFRWLMWKPTRTVLLSFCIGFQVVTGRVGPVEPFARLPSIAGSTYAVGSTSCLGSFYCSLEPTCCAALRCRAVYMRRSVMLRCSASGAHTSLRQPRSCARTQELHSSSLQQTTYKSSKQQCKHWQRYNSPGASWRARCPR